MGKPVVEFKELFLTHFLREVHDDFIREYCCRLRRALEPFYGSVSISEEEFTEKLSLTGRFDVEPPLVPRYQFLARNDNEEETWMMGLRRTQISHFFGGIKQRSSLRFAIGSALARSLVSERAADIVGLPKSQPPSNDLADYSAGACRRFQTYLEVG